MFFEIEATINFTEKKRKLQHALFWVYKNMPAKRFCEELLQSLAVYGIHYSHLWHEGWH